MTKPLTSPCTQVNKIRELPQHPAVVVTHTDAPELYVWNTATQPNMTRDKVRCAVRGRTLCAVMRCAVLGMQPASQAADASA